MKKKIIFGIAFVILLVLVIFGTKTYLYLNFMLGNDILIRLQAEKEDFLVERAEPFDLEFKSSIITNPFCVAECTTSFEDLSEEKILNQNSIILKTGSPFDKKYSLKIEDFGEGQKLYRYTLECESKKSVLCHTNEEKTKTDMLVTVEYFLNEEEKILKNELHTKLINLKTSLEDQEAKITYINNINETMGKILNIDSQEVSFMNSLVLDKIKLLDEAESIWDKQDYSSLETMTNSILEADLNEEISSLFELFLERINIYQSQLNNLSEIKIVLEDLLKLNYLDQTEKLLIKTLIIKFNDHKSIFESTDTFENKILFVETLKNNSKSTKDLILLNHYNAAIKNIVDLDIQYSVLCNLSSNCLKRPTILKRSEQTDYNLESACLDIELLKSRYEEINNTINLTNQTEGNSEKILGSLISKTARTFLSELPENKTNTKIIKSFLNEQNILEEELEIVGSNFVLLELIKNQPISCQNINLNSTIKNIELKKISFSGIIYNDLHVDFSQPADSCCVFNECRPCCRNDECRVNYPVIFVHGHAFNKGTEAGYSLEAFNFLQDKLEDEGFINAGALSIYDLKTIRDGSWGLMFQPISLKTSYYFDVYQEAEAYHWVQTKTENIDTYSLKLNDIINTVLEKTSSDKVIVIAHSMGGLVTRRYLQIFGEDKVDKLILVGTPNHGVMGRVADFCSITGEKLECRDLKEDSLFMNKLNREALPNIEIFNIVGTGCDMQGMDGDGIVVKDSAKLEGVENLFVKGSCNGLNLFHTEMFSSKYPEIYNAILNVLKE